jgi:hypothetical protein
MKELLYMTERTSERRMLLEERSIEHRRPHEFNEGTARKDR